MPLPSPYNRSAAANPGCEPANAPIPLTLSLFLSQDMYPHARFTPVASLLFPVVKIRAADSYIAIIAIELFTILIVKYAAACHCRNHCLVMPPYSHGYPDMRALQQIFSQAAVPASPASGQTAQQASITTIFDPPAANGTQSMDSPVFPKGVAFNLYLSAPLEASDSPNTATSYLFRLFEIRNLPGYLILVVGLLIYTFLYPRIGAPAKPQKGGNVQHYGF